MKRVVRALANLYPLHWRDRYGEEFDAFLAEVDLNWRDVINVLQGAFTMRLRSLGWVTFAFAIAGAIIAGLASFTMPKTYSATATLHMQSPDRAGGCNIVMPSGAPKQDEVFRAADVRNSGTGLARKFVADSLSQDSLAAIISQENLSYSVSNLRRATNVEYLYSDASANDTAFRVTFADLDSAKARRVETDMIARLMEANQTAPIGLLCFAGPMSFSTTHPNRLLVTGTGCGIGSLVGAIAQWLIRATRFRTA